MWTCACITWPGQIQGSRIFTLVRNQLGHPGGPSPALQSTQNTSLRTARSIPPPPGIRACHCAKGTCSLLPQTGPAASWTHSRDALFSGALLMQNHGPLRHPSSWPLCIKENQGLEKRQSEHSEACWNWSSSPHPQIHQAHFVSLSCCHAHGLSSTPGVIRKALRQHTPKAVWPFLH